MAMQIKQDTYILGCEAGWGSPDTQSTVTNNNQTKIPM